MLLHIKEENSDSGLALDVVMRVSLTINVIGGSSHAHIRNAVRT